MLYKSVLKSLSDTEIVVISRELNDPNISNESIMNQLMAKSNDTLFTRHRIVDIPELLLDLCDELSRRLLERDAAQVDLFN